MKPYNFVLLNKAVIKPYLVFCVDAAQTRAVQIPKANRWITGSEGPNRSTSVNVDAIGLIFLCLRLRGQQHERRADIDNKDVFRAK